MNLKKSRDLSASPAIIKLVQKLNSERSKYAVTLKQIAGLNKFLSKISLADWENNFMIGLDAVTLYGLVAIYNPPIYFEIGSGYSTKFVRRAIKDHKLRTKIISIDPEPRTSIDSMCDVIYRKRLEDTDLTIFDQLTKDDVFFMDGSHNSFMNSDVTVFFTEILSKFPKGLLYGLHDIFIPYDYPQRWAERSYNEQYLLACYLFGGADGDEIIVPNTFVLNDKILRSLVDALWKNQPMKIDDGSAFWLRKN